MASDSLGRDLVDTLYYGDNLEVLSRFISDESVDLVYLDPPFNKNAAYSVIFRDESGRTSDAQLATLEDYWHWGPTPAAHYRYLTNSSGHRGRVPAAVSSLVGALHSAIKPSPMFAYLVEMTVRLVELHRVLKPTGSLWLHCDPTASHYLKLLLDAVFGPRCFRNEVVWKRTNARSTTGRFPRIHDVLLYYTKTNRFTFHPRRVPADDRKVPHTLIKAADGLKYQTFELTAPGVTREGLSGRPWQGQDPTSMGRHWANSHDRMDAWDREGLIHWPSRGGFPRRRAAEPFDPSAREVTVSDVWTDIDRLNQSARERLGYPTQKPRPLLERIIEACSDAGDVVLDPFCGCGTAIEAAVRTERRWIGIDYSIMAVDAILGRMRDANIEVPLFYWPTEPDGLARMAEGPDGRHRFETWALDRLGLPENQRGGDRGVDGRLTFTEARGRQRTIIVSVKSGSKVGPAAVRELRGAMARERAPIGVLVINGQPTREMEHEANSATPYASDAHGRSFPGVVIHPAELLLDGTMPDLPIGFGIQGELSWPAPVARAAVRRRLARRRPLASPPRRPRPRPVEVHPEVARIREELANLVADEDVAAPDAGAAEAVPLRAWGNGEAD